MHKYRETQKQQAKKRRQMIVRMRDQGKSLAEVAALMGISVQRVNWLELQEREGRIQH